MVRILFIFFIGILLVFAGALDENNRRRLQTNPDWYVNFLSVQAVFNNSNAPEVELDYNGPAPIGDYKYYKMHVMNPNCARFIYGWDDASITTDYTNDRIPSTAYDNATAILASYVYINTSAISSSPNFYTPGPTKELFNITFCVQVDLFNDKGYSTATEHTIVNLNVNTSVSFEVNGIRAQRKEPTVANENAVVDFPLHVYYCNDTGSEITQNTLFPGEPFQFCVEADSTSAIVDSLRLVNFLNDLDASISIPLIDMYSDPTNQQTTMVCGAGKCRLKTVAYAALYAKRNPDGSLTDISAGVKVSGTALLSFVKGRRLNSVPGTTFQNTRGQKLPPGDNAVADFALDVKLVHVPSKYLRSHAEKRLFFIGGVISWLVTVALL